VEIKKDKIRQKKGIVVEESKQEDLLSDLFAFNDEPLTANKATKGDVNNVGLFESTGDWPKSQTTTAPANTSNTSGWPFDSQTQQSQNSDNFFTSVPSTSTNNKNNAMVNNGMQSDLFGFDNASNGKFSSNSATKMSGQGQARKLEKQSSNNMNSNDVFGDLTDFNNW